MEGGDGFRLTPDKIDQPRATQIETNLIQVGSGQWRVSGIKT